MSIIYGTASGNLLNGTNTADTIYGLGGSDTIHGFEGDDKLVGEVESVMIIRSTISGNVTDPIPVFGDDYLYGDGGNDQLYGDLVSLTLLAEAGTDAGSRRVTGVVRTFGNDTLDGGVGDDVLVGDAGLILLSSLGGGTLAAPVTVKNSSGLVSFNSITTGADTLWGGNGVDVLYGDVALLRLEGIGGTVNGKATEAMGRLVGNQFFMAGDELHGGSENDSLYGDIGRLEFFGQGGNSLSSGDVTLTFLLTADVTSGNFNVFTMGNDYLYGDEGSDYLVGDIGTLRFDGFGGQNSAGVAANAQIAATRFFYGADHLEGGNGEDALWGDMENLEIFGQGGTTSGTGVAAFVAIGSRYTLGADTLLGENENDVIYGDVGNITHTFLGGTITSSAAVSQTWASTFGPNAQTILTMGSDVLLSGGNGDDFLVGDVGSMSFFLQGGTNAGATLIFNADHCPILDSNFLMGNDLLDGGSGNDTLYGDLVTFSAILINGTGVGTTPMINNTIIRFGDDTLIGGSGDDVLVGDIADSTQLLGWLNAPLRPVGTIPNQVIFGNDTFEFSLGGANGIDVVKDMNGGGIDGTVTSTSPVNDTLRFTDVMDVNGGGSDVTDVDAQVSFSNSGGHLLMSFSGGSVLFENITYVGGPSQDSVLDITPNVTVI